MKRIERQLEPSAVTQFVSIPRAAAGWFEAGIKEAQGFQAAFERCREHAVNAAFFFMKARAGVDNSGNWGLMLDAYKEKIKPRTVRFYIQLGEAAVEWVRVDQPQLAPAKLHEAAREVMMMSPKPLVALLRDLRLMRPFGEYDAVKYAQKKLANGQQVEFAFDKLVATADILAHLDTYDLRFPEGTDHKEALTELREKLQTAVVKVDEQIKEWEAVPI